MMGLDSLFKKKILARLKKTAIFVLIYLLTKIGWLFQSAFRIKNYEGSYSKKYQDRVPCKFPYKHVCVDDKFSKPSVVFRGSNAAYEFIKAILNKFEYCKKVMKKHFNKNLIMSEEKEKEFQSSNTCWICEKLIDNDDKKARDHFQDLEAHPI